MKIKNLHHRNILDSIIALSGNPTQHTNNDKYLGTTHPRYPINGPTMRMIARGWMRDHKTLPIHDFEALLTSLITGKSSTEKIMAAMLLDAATKNQVQINPKLFEGWLEHLEGWAEIDALCSGKYSVTEVPRQWPVWKKIITRFSKSKDIRKRRAALVLLCHPVRKISHADLSTIAFETIQQLKLEKEILITKAISWLLRSMTKLYKKEVADFLNSFESTLPKIAVRETRVKLLTGRKYPKK